jgi:alpha-galactosidase
VLELRLEAGARAAATVTDLRLVASPRLADGFPAWIVHNGYQSWDAAGVLPAAGKNVLGKPARRESWWTCGLASAGGSGLALAARRAHASAVRFDLADGQLAVAWCQPPSLDVSQPLWVARAGETWHGDPIAAGVGADVRSVIASLASAPAAAADGTPRGWLSWYHLGPWVSGTEVKAASAALAAPPFADLGYQVVQVDDGWQQAYGDWRPNAKFEGGLAPLCREARSRGQALGVWTAPFLVSASSDLAEKAPEDWFVRTPATGARVVDSRHVAFGPMYVLDPARPAVRRHLRDAFSGLYDAGIRYFKIDFLYAGAHSGIPALRRAVAVIRAAVRDSYLLASGAPLLPLAGLVQGCRVGPDTATPLFDFELGAPKPTIFGDELVWVARNVAGRHFLRGWFQLDADVALVGGNLSVDQARQLVTVVALSGGPFFASDVLAELPPDRLGLLTNREVLDLVGGEPAVPDWDPDESDRPPRVWRRGDMVAVFNWSSEATAMTVDVGGRRRVREVWEGRDLGVADGLLEVALPAFGTRLVRLGEA